MNRFTTAVLVPLFWVTTALVSPSVIAQQIYGTPGAPSASAS